MKEAMFYTKLGDGKVRCELCRHRCILRDGQIGICKVRKNIGGKLYTLVYGKPIAVHIDPIEKKPLFHFLPGARAFSIATVGCNFRCKFCQNWDISQPTQIEGYDLPPETAVELAEQHNCEVIAYTYTEPTVFYEYAYDMAKLAHERGIKNVFVTNGYITRDALEAISPYLDGANVDLKGMNREFYSRYIGARLSELLDSIKVFKELGIWLEVTTLVVPGYNDREDELRAVADFIKNELGEDTPWHVSRFYPHYKMRFVPPTPLETLLRARDIGYEVGLKYIYVGNVPGESEDTVCPNCHRKLIRRWGFSVMENKITSDGKCPYCGTKIAGVWT
ncbi:MAG: AmmeMemoRadiSam system radical SAM enzyme [Candidatus Hydrothermota bacterium]|nr:MAG: AmmeMemoRadiSam system radical SAM enzyme [Candidatus Hydrothermae bacterium]